MAKWAIFSLLVTLALAACAPAAPPSSPVEGVGRTWAIYLSGQQPAVLGATVEQGVQVVSDMAQLKVQTGQDAVAIWIDTAVVGQIDQAWLAARYRQRNPLFLIGSGAHQHLLALIGDDTRKPSMAMAAFRQHMERPHIQEGIWPQIPPVAELISQSQRLLMEGPVKTESVSIAEAPLRVREFAKKLGPKEVAQTLRIGSDIYLFIVGGWEILRVQREMGVVQASVSRRTGAPHVAIWRLQTDGLPVDVQGEPEYLPQVVNWHGLPEVPIADEAVLITPVAGTKGNGAFHVSGYIRAFEATFNLRLRDQSGKEIALQHGMAASGAPDWGSFLVRLPYQGKGKATLELFVVSMKDGSEILLRSIPVER